MNASELRQHLASRPMLFDGGMGTQLMALGLASGACGVRWNVDEPSKVRQVHAAYASAGCGVLTTNTFQGTRTALAMHGLGDEVVAINEAGARVAKQAAGDGVLVAGDVGPFGGFLEPLGETTESALHDLFVEQMTALKSGGADLALIETMSDLNEVRCAIHAAKAVADWPIVATYAFQKAGDQFVTMMGVSAGDIIAATLDAGADVVGANCGTNLDLTDYVRLADVIAAAARPTGGLTIIQPNAGSPITRDGQLHYPATPEEMAAIVQLLRDAGMHMIGGCCGTTPAHLAAMATIKP